MFEIAELYKYDYYDLLRNTFFFSIYSSNCNDICDYTCVWDCWSNDRLSLYILTIILMFSLSLSHSFCWRCSFIRPRLNPSPGPDSSGVRLWCFTISTLWSQNNFICRNEKNIGSSPPQPVTLTMLQLKPQMAHGLLWLSHTDTQEFGLPEDSHSRFTCNF